MIRAIAATALGCCCLVALAQSVEPGQDDERAILAQRLAFNAAIARNDSEAIGEFLDDSFQITTGAGEQLLHGAREELESWREFFDRYDDVRYERVPESIVVSNYLPRAAEFGSWTGHANMAGELREFSGRYAAAWNKVDGRWKVASELYVTLDCEGDDC